MSDRPSKTSELLLTCRIEAKAIKDAAAKCGANYKPKLTFVVCAKRVSQSYHSWDAAHEQHSMRFFATSSSDVDRSGNLPAGEHTFETKVKAADTQVRSLIRASATRSPLTGTHKAMPVFKVPPSRPISQLQRLSEFPPRD